MPESQELWKEVKDFPGYIVSTHGRVARLLKPMQRGQGHYGVNLVRSLFNGRGSGRAEKFSKLVHRLVAEAFLKPPFPWQDLVRHLDGNPRNNRVENLAWGDRSDNHADAVKHGVAAIGERHHMARVKDADIAVIRHLASVSPLSEVADLYGISVGNVSRIVRGKTWRHIPMDADDA